MRKTSLGLVRQITPRACKSGHREVPADALYSPCRQRGLAKPEMPGARQDVALGRTPFMTKRSLMLWLAILLLVAWLLGFAVFHVAGGLIHLLLVIAVVVFLINFISGRRTV
jgi:hypothetical protein